MRRSCLARAVFVAVLSLVASRAQADVPPSADDSPVVELAVAGEFGAAVSARVESWFRGRVPVTRASAQPSALRTLPGPAAQAGVRVWIALEDPTTARVLFAVQRRPGQTPRYLVSDVPVEGGLDELGIERLGQIVYLSAMALWEGSVESSTEEVVKWLQRRPSEPPPPPPPTTQPTPSPSTAEAARWVPRVGAEYAATMGGDEGVAQTVGADMAALRQTESTAIGARVRARVFVPRDVTTSSMTLDLRGFGFGLGAAVERRVGVHAWVPAELGLRMDVVRYRSGSFTDPSYRAETGGTDVRPTAYVRCGFRYDLGGVAVGLAATLDTYLVRAHYDLSDNGRRTAIVTPWLVQPGITAGASW